MISVFEKLNEKIWVFLWLLKNDCNPYVVLNSKNNEIMQFLLVSEHWAIQASIKNYEELKHICGDNGYNQIDSGVLD